MQLFLPQKEIAHSFQLLSTQPINIIRAIKEVYTLCSAPPYYHNFSCIFIFPVRQNSNTKYWECYYSFTCNYIAKRGFLYEQHWTQREEGVFFYRNKVHTYKSIYLSIEDVSTYLFPLDFFDIQRAYHFLERCLKN